MGLSTFLAPLRAIASFAPLSRPECDETPAAKTVKTRSASRERRRTAKHRHERKVQPALAIEEVQALTRSAAAGADVSRDGRVRLRGSAALDICASPAALPKALDAFDQWLGYLRLVGIPVEMRQEDGWRVCAMVDGIPSVIRVRERMRRVSAMNRLSGFLESLLGGRVPETLEPSGRLEAQVMRFGVCAFRMPLGEDQKDWDFRGITSRLKENARHEASRLAKQRRRAEHLRLIAAVPNRSPKAAPTQGEPETRKRIAELTSTLESLLAMQLIHPSNAYLANRGMDSSLHQLASRCGKPPSPQSAGAHAEPVLAAPLLVARKGGRRKKIA